ncbi:DUF378 domain-containing protein [Candidatus Kaiserbacteria bacterium]|nr:DUF378 domain-containing protein [Candidatus Kaiserbacteria bacterium]
MKMVHMVAFVLAMVGALNWGLVGVGMFAGGNWNLVYLILGSWPIVESIVYVLVGLSAVWLVIQHKGDCKSCVASTM